MSIVCKNDVFEQANTLGWVRWTCVPLYRCRTSAWRSVYSVPMNLARDCQTCSMCLVCLYKQRSCCLLAKSFENCFSFDPAFSFVSYLLVYLYGEAARKESRRSLPSVRAGEYEALPEKVRTHLDLNSVHFLVLVDHKSMTTLRSSLGLFTPSTITILVSIVVYNNWVLQSRMDSDWLSMFLSLVIWKKPRSESHSMPQYPFGVIFCYN